MVAHLHPKTAPAGSVCVWAAVQGVAGDLPEPEWRVEGLTSGLELAAPTRVVRPLGRIREAGRSPFVWSGVYEFSGFQPSERVRVRAAWPGMAPAEVTVSVLPARLPAASSASAGNWFRVLMVSCHHYTKVNAEGLKRVVNQLRADGGVDVSLFMGDQVYLDLPWWKPYADDEQWLADTFEDLYGFSWFDGAGAGGYSALLRLAPHACVPDDHEYWNNFPEAAPHLQNTHWADGRRRWQRAAQRLYQGFQQHTPTLGEPVIINVAPASIFMADSRTHRVEGNDGEAYSSGTLARLQAWVDQVNGTADGLGIFVTGQSLLDPRVNWVSGKVGDKHLANYSDYDDLWRALSRLTRPFLIMTGDVHFGRLVRIESLQPAGPRGWEVIVSPAALCQGGEKLFSFDSDWPDHGGPEAPPEKIADLNLRTGKKTSLERSGFTGQKGDHVGVLSLRTINNRVKVRMDYYPITNRPDVYGRWRRSQELNLE